MKLPLKNVKKVDCGTCKGRGYIKFTLFESKHFTIRGIAPCGICWGKGYIKIRY